MENKQDILKEVANIMGTTKTKIYEDMGIARQSADHLRKNTPHKYIQLANEYILKRYNIGTLELIKILDLYNIQKDKD